MSLKYMLVFILGIFLLIPYLLYGRIIFYSTYIVGRVVLFMLIFLIISLITKRRRKKISYEVNDSEISYKKRKIRLDEIKKLTINKVGSRYGIILNNIYKKNSLGIPLKDISEMEKLKTLILERSNPEKIKESKFDQLWVGYIMLAIPVIMFLISFTWNTALEPFPFQYSELSINNVSTANYTFEVKDIEFQDKLSEEKYYLLTSQGKITFKEYDKPEQTVLQSMAFFTDQVSSEEEKPDWSIIDYYLSNFEGILIRYMKKNYVKNYNLVAYNSNEIEAILLHIDNSKKLYLRSRGSDRNLQIEFSKEFDDDDILKVLETVKFKS